MTDLYYVDLQSANRKDTYPETRRLRARIAARHVDESQVKLVHESVKADCPHCGHEIASNDKFYWSCGVNTCFVEHQHRDSAMFCLKKNSGSSPMYRKSKTWKEIMVSRKRLVSHIHEKTGCTLQELGNQFNVSRERARQMANQGARSRWGNFSHKSWKPVDGYPEI